MGWNFSFKVRGWRILGVIKMINRKRGKASNFEFLVSDQGEEFMSTVFKKYLKKRGIEHMIGPADTPQYFSVVGRAKWNDWRNGKIWGNFLKCHGISMHAIYITVHGDIDMQENMQRIFRTDARPSPISIIWLYTKLIQESYQIWKIFKFLGHRAWWNKKENNWKTNHFQENLWVWWGQESILGYFRWGTEAGVVKRCCF